MRDPENPREISDLILALVADTARSGPASPGGLDVERLDATWKNLTQQGGHAYGYMGVSKHVWRAFAAEYARLTEEATR